MKKKKIKKWQETLVLQKQMSHKRVNKIESDNKTAGESVTWLLALMRRAGLPGLHSRAAC